MTVPVQHQSGSAHRYGVPTSGLTHSVNRVDQWGRTYGQVEHRALVSMSRVPLVVI